MVAFLQAHLVFILSMALGVSELLALAVPSAGGILALIISALKALGAKEPPQG